MVKRVKREHKDIKDIRVTQVSRDSKDLLVIKETQFLGGMLIKVIIVPLMESLLLQNHLDLV